MSVYGVIISLKSQTYLLHDELLAVRENQALLSGLYLTTVEIIQLTIAHAGSNLGLADASEILTLQHVHLEQSALLEESDLSLATLHFSGQSLSLYNQVILSIVLALLIVVLIGYTDGEPLGNLFSLFAVNDDILCKQAIGRLFGFIINRIKHGLNMNRSLFTSSRECQIRIVGGVQIAIGCINEAKDYVASERPSRTSILFLCRSDSEG